MIGIIRHPVMTEKMTILKDQRQYAFEVDPKSTKIDIVRAIEKKFKVKVTSVRTQNIRGKRKTQLTRAGRFEGRSRQWKMAIVTLKEGDVIDLVEIV